jgi:hypothetical protein
MGNFWATFLPFLSNYYQNFEQLVETPNPRAGPREDFFCVGVMYTRKNAQVVTNLQQTCSNAVPTTCQQDVFALLVNNLLQGC